MVEGQGALEASLGNWLANLGSTEAALGLLETAEDLLAAKGFSETPPEIWHRYLNDTRRTVFLQALPDPTARDRWAETTFPVLRASQFPRLASSVPCPSIMYRAP